MTTKIFGIGLNKTGTSALGSCGRILGLRCVSHQQQLLADYVFRNDLSKMLDIVNNNDLFEDTPWHMVYKQLDQYYPGSKFILTVRRSEEAWIESFKKHCLRKDPTSLSEKLVYGFNYPQNHEEHFIEQYRNHNNDVRTYFKGRERDLLEVCWEKGDGYKEICEFLGYNIPKNPFPHINRGIDQWMNPFRVSENKRLILLDT